MENMTIFTLQDTLRKMPYVSVPQIQQDFGLTYKEAKVFLGELLDRGWVEKEPEGNRYPVKAEQLRLRSIERNEVETLIDEMDMNCVAVLQYILKQRALGAEFDEIVNTLDDKEDATKTIYLLTKNRLIYIHEESYFLCVSQKVVKVLSDVVRAKRSWELGRRITGKETDRSHVRRMFDCLFQPG